MKLCDLIHHHTIDKTTKEVRILVVTFSYDDAACLMIHHIKNADPEIMHQLYEDQW